MFKFVIFKGHHDNLAHKALEEFVEFDDTIEAVLKRVNLGMARLN